MHIYNFKACLWFLILVFFMKDNVSIKHVTDMQIMHYVNLISKVIMLDI